MWEQLYLLAVLPAAQLGLALLTVGLIRPWGEVFPRWLPALVVAGWRWPSPWAPHRRGRASGGVAVERGGHGPAGRPATAPHAAPTRVLGAGVGGAAPVCADVAMAPRCCWR
jgi:hypothetical protein